MATERSPKSWQLAHLGVRPPVLKPEHIGAMREIVTKRARASLQEIADELHHHCGMRVFTATVRRALRWQGTVRYKPVRTASKAAKPAKR